MYPCEHPKPIQETLTTTKEKIDELIKAGIPDLIIQLNNNRLKIQKLMPMRGDVLKHEKFDKLLDQRQDLITAISYYSQDPKTEEE